MRRVDYVFFKTRFEMCIFKRGSFFNSAFKMLDSPAVFGSPWLSFFSTPKSRLYLANKIKRRAPKSVGIVIEASAKAISMDNMRPPEGKHSREYGVLPFPFCCASALHGNDSS